MTGVFSWLQQRQLWQLAALPCEELLRYADFIPASDEQRSPLMKRFRLKIENTLFPIGGCASCLLDYIAERVILIHEPELPVPVLRVPGVAINPAIQKRAMHVCHQGADVPERIWPS